MTPGPSARHREGTSQAFFLGIYQRRRPGTPRKPKPSVEPMIFHLFRARRKKRGTEWLTDAFIRKVHEDMFGNIWEWGGQYRQTRLNIDVEPHRIREQIKLLTGDFFSWNEATSTMPVVEIAARLQHRLTQIHPFLNGNGRHARLMTDISFYSRHHSIPQWPQIQLMSQGNQVREHYIRAMKNADEGDLTNLIQFIEECLKEGH